MITTFVRRVLPLIGLAVVLGACIRRIQVDDPGSDMWFHLRLGHEFLQGWSIARPGHLGVFDSADWTPTQWLAQIAMAGMEDAFGVAGVIWLAGAIHVALVITLYVFCRREASPLPATIATALAFLALTIGLSPRPQIVSYVFVAVTVQAWLATERDGKVRWWLVGIAWLWAPIHGMWPLAAITGAVCVAGIALGRQFDRARVLRMAAIPLLSAVVPLLTPVGLDLYRAVLLVGGRSEYFVEWGPTDFHRPYAVVLAIMLAIAVVHAARVRPSWMGLFVLLMAAGWAVYSARTTPVAAVLVTPLVARALQSIVPATGAMQVRERWAVAVMGLLAVCGLAVVSPQRAEVPVVPAWADARLAALPDRTPVLDDWTTGPYYLWKHPGLDLVMHGYGDVFTDEEIKRNKDIMLLNPGWDRLVEELEPEVALVVTDSPLGYALSHDDRWSVVQEDDDFVFLERSR